MKANGQNTSSSLFTKDFEKITSGSYLESAGNILEKSKKCDDFLTAVENPSHYQDITIIGKNGQMDFEAIEIIDSVLTNLNFNPAVSHAIGDSLKYILRCGKKDSDNNTTTDLKSKGKQDLLKSSWYLKRAADMF